MLFNLLEYNPRNAVVDTNEMPRCDRVLTGRYQFIQIEVRVELVPCIGQLMQTHHAVVLVFQMVDFCEAFANG